jgi:heterotetrameric sarcosine oxidase delta subunit
MNQLRCPFCGPRELHEYEFRKTRESVQTSQFAKVYLRVDSLDLSAEYWQHVLGCRAWLLVRRNPSTGMILDTTALPGDCL